MYEVVSGLGSSAGAHGFASSEVVSAALGLHVEESVRQAGRQAGKVPAVTPASLQHQSQSLMPPYVPLLPRFVSANQLPTCGH